MAEKIFDRLEQQAYDAVMTGIRNALKQFESGSGMQEVSPPSSKRDEGEVVTARAVGRRSRRASGREALSPGQQEVYDVIKAYYEEHGVSPTYAEIAEAVDKTGVGAQVLAIAKKGWIELDPEKSSRKIIPL